MGSWEYYICRMLFSEAVEYLKFAEQVSPYEELDKLLQREISSRAKEITNYLENNTERFFGSLIVAVYGGSPKFSPIEIEGASFLGSRIGTVGVLNFDGKENYYVLDGQHRLAAMRDACKANAERYKDDEVSVILVSHPKNSEGIQRARRLFTNVNRYAVKTNKSTNIALDEDDPLAILTRRLVRENLYFREVVKVATRNKEGIFKLVSGEALRIGTDDGALMTLPTLYECNRSLLSGHSIAEAERQQRPSEALLEEAWSELDRRWTAVLNNVPQFSFSETERKFDRNREDGGLLIARPIAQKAICRSIGLGYRSGISEDLIFSAVQRVPRLSENPWKGLLWNPEDGTMFAGKERMELASDILCLWMSLGEDAHQISERLRIISSGTAVLS